jgi:lipoteichoic acid synthase
MNTAFNYDSIKRLKSALAKYNVRALGFDIFKTNTIGITTFFIIFIKSIIFIGLIGSSEASTINLSNAFYGPPHYLIFSCFIIIPLSISFLFKGRKQLWYLLLLDIFTTIIILADLWYYRGFYNFLTIHQLKQSSNLNNLWDCFSSMLRFIDILFILDLIIFLILLLKNKNLYKGKKRNIKFTVIVITISVLYISHAHYRIDIQRKNWSDILFRICWTPRQTMSNLSPIGYHIYDSYVYYKESKPYKLSSVEKTEVEQWFVNKEEKLPDNKYKGIFKGKNLIFIQVESFENFIINQKIHGQEITPNVNKLLKNSIYFSNFYEQVYGGTSSDGDLMSNTSVYPIRRGSTFFRYPKNTYNSLPHLLNKEGYSTIAIHPDKGSYWNWLPALTSFGFKECIDESYFTLDEHIGLGLSDESFLRQVEPIIKSKKEPFYTFMVTLTSHSPFNIPDKYRSLKLTDSMNKNYLGGYFQSLNHTDRQLGTFISSLEKDGLLSNTVVVIYGDHTGVHKYYDQSVKEITPSEPWWHTNNNRVPFIIYSKDYEGEEITTNGGHVDILPTVAYLMGIDENSYSLTAMGRNLLKTTKNYAVLSNGTLVGGETMTEKEKKEAISGLDIADKIIRSNYFNEKLDKIIK